MRNSILIWAVLCISSGFAFAKVGHSESCKKIKEACEKAGFVKGQAKAGRGLWKDCIDPIVHGAPARKKAALPLPTVEPIWIEECKSNAPQHSAGNASK